MAQGIDAYASDKDFVNVEELRRRAREASAKGGGQQVANPLKSRMGGVFAEQEMVPEDFALQLEIARRLREYKR